MIKMKETKRNNRILSVLLALVFLLGAFSTTVVYADDGVDYVEIENKLYGYYEDSYYMSDLGLTQSELDSLRQDIYDAVSSHSAYLDVSAYNIAYNSESHRALGLLVNKRSDPRLFAVRNFGFYKSGGDFSYIDFFYDMTKSAYLEKLKLCEAAAEKMTSDLKESSLSDAEKALILHDRLIVLNEYDLTYNGEHSYDMCGPLINNTSVCDGYAQAYKYLLDIVGIRSYIIISSQLNHSWNIVYIDGKKYHVDTTWDDPVYDVTGSAYHNNFLLSSSALYASGHYATDYDMSPEDTTYDKYFWRKVDTAFQYLNGKIYYIDKNVSALKTWNGTDSTAVFTIKGGRWEGFYSKLSASRNYLYYSISNGIYRYDTVTGKALLVYGGDIFEHDTFSIFGFKADDTYFYYEFCDGYYDENTKAAYGAKYKYTEPVQTEYGDINGDYEIDSSDAGMALKSDAGMITLNATQSPAGDVNGDGEVDSADATMILKYDAGLITSFR